MGSRRYISDSPASPSSQGGDSSQARWTVRTGRPASQSVTISPLTARLAASTRGPGVGSEFQYSVIRACSGGEPAMPPQDQG
jgi:hypothetical protein